MTDDQTRTINMGISVLAVMDDAGNQPLWTGINSIVNKVFAFRTSKNEILRLAGVQETDITGNAQDKKQKRKDMAEAALEICKPLTVFARDTNNEVLEEEIDFELSDLLRGKDITSKERCQLVRDRANANVGSLGDYNIDAPKIADLQNKITLFTNVMGAPRAAKTVTKAATTAIDAEFVVYDDAFTGLSELMVMFRTSEPDFYNSFLAAAEIVDTGVRKIMLRVKATDADTDVVIEKATCELLGTGGLITEKTTKTGNASFKMLAVGTYKLTVKKGGYQDFVVAKVGITGTEMVKIDAEMVSV